MTLVDVEFPVWGRVVYGPSVHYLAKATSVPLYLHYGEGGDASVLEWAIDGSGNMNHQRSDCCAAWFVKTIADPKAGSDAADGDAAAADGDAADGGATDGDATASALPAAEVNDAIVAAPTASVKVAATPKRSLAKAKGMTAKSKPKAVPISMRAKAALARKKRAEMATVEEPTHKMSWCMVNGITTVGGKSFSRSRLGVCNPTCGRSSLLFTSASGVGSGLDADRVYSVTSIVFVFDWNLDAQTGLLQ